MTFRERFDTTHNMTVDEIGESTICVAKCGYEDFDAERCRTMPNCKFCWDRKMPTGNSANALTVKDEVCDKSALHEKLCEELTDTYRRKNHDYGDSFHQSYTEDGLTMAKIRIGDKYNRFKSLIKYDQKVADESIRDTLMDMANYCIMTVMEMEE